MKLFIRRFGQGNPVIILHGLLGVSDNWVSFGRRLGAAFGVFIPDLRNHGQSPHSTIFNFSVLSDDLHELIEEYNLSDVILIGHSLGGKAAMQFAFQYQDLTAKLVIVDIAPRKYPPDLDLLNLIRAMMKVDFSIVHSRTEVERQLEKNIPSLRLRQFLLKNVYWKDKETLAWRANLSVLFDSLPFLQGSITSILAFKKPVLFVRGGLSDYIVDSDLPEIMRLFPLASVKTIANASHWVHADAPGEFYDHVNEFLVTD